MTVILSSVAILHSMTLVLQQGLQCPSDVIMTDDIIKEVQQ